jgi:peptidoglycan/LPS O-acetylase OafA/YrhL
MAARFTQLDALRFLFALVVAVGHSIGFKLTLVHGPFAVDFFFVLSGFVLSHALIARGVSIREFTWARFARLYPLHLATLLWMVGPVMRDGGDPASTGGAFAINIFMLQGLGFLNDYSWNFPAWSIGVEFIVNVLILYPIVRARSLLAALIVVGLSQAVILLTWGAVYDLFAIEHAWGPLITAGILRGTAGIVLGYLLYEAYLYVSTRIDHTRYVHLATAFECTTLILLVVSLGIDDARWNVLPVPLSTLLVLQMATVPGRLSTLFQTRIFSALGEMSYSVYLLHVPVFLAFHTMGLLPLPDTGGFSFAWFLTYLGVLLVLSAASFRYFERPAQRALMRLFRGRRPATAVT